MGKKRKNEDSEERIRRKIRRLNEKLKKRHRIIYSDDNEDPSPLRITDHHDKQCDNVCLPSEPIIIELEPTPGCSQTESIAIEPCVAMDPDPTTTQDTEGLSNAVDEVDLDTDILALLGEPPEPETNLGENIHKDLAARWLEIIRKGLGKDVKEQLAKLYPIPGNCELLVPPLLNPEAKAALTEPFLKRDSSLMYRQKQMSNALAALAPAIEIIISKNCDPELQQKLLKPMSDASRILCDMYHNETKMRKKFVVSSVSAGLRDTLVNSSTDKYLFGDNMSEKIKNAKNVQKSGEALKVTQGIQKTNFSNNYNSNRKNFKPLHQKVAGKQYAGKNQPVHRQYQQQSSSRAPPRRAARERSPPAPPQSPPASRRGRNNLARR